MYGDGACALDGHFGPRTRAVLNTFLREHDLDGSHGPASPGGGGRGAERGGAALLSLQAAAMLRESSVTELENKAIKAAADSAMGGAANVTKDNTRLLQLSLNQVA